MPLIRALCSHWGNVAAKIRDALGRGSDVHRGGHHTGTEVETESVARIANGLKLSALFPSVMLWK